MFKPKIAKCITCSKETYIYAKKMCKDCYWKQNAESKKAKAPKKDVLEKVEWKGKKFSTKALEQIKKDNEFYKEIWAEREHICEECGIYLGDVMNKVFMSHHLTKGSTPTQRYNKLNINLLCYQHHSDWEFGDKKKMRIYNEELYLELKSSQ
jgi:hypothetical protein